MAWSCVADEVPAIWSSVVVWLATATQLAGIDPDRLHVHHVCPLRPEIARICASLGVHVHPVTPFDARSPHCNKVQACSTDFGRVEWVALTDADMAFVRPVPHPGPRGAVAGKLVDGPNPPVERLQAIFESAGVAPPPALRLSWVPPEGRVTDFETVAGNFNGGLYLVPAPWLAHLGRQWARWARWLLDRPGLLGSWRIHVDQVAFCLALHADGIGIRALGSDWNFPLHRRVPDAAVAPLLLHHHAALDAALGLLPPVDERAGAAVEVVNAAVERFVRHHLRLPASWMASSRHA